MVVKFNQFVFIVMLSCFSISVSMDEGLSLDSSISSLALDPSSAAIDNYLNEELIFAIEGDDVEEVADWIDRGADVNCQSKGTGQTPLYVATQFGNLNIVNFLLVNGADVNGRNRDGKTPLFAGVNNFRIAQKLINVGANPNIADNKKETPLFLAVEGDRLGIINLLLSSGAFVGVRRKDGMTPLHEAIMRNRYEIIKRLIESSSVGTLNIADVFNRTPLHLAVSASNPNKNVVSDLLSYGADYKAKDLLGHTALDIARNQRQLHRNIESASDYEAIVKILKNFSKDSRNQDKDQIVYNFFNSGQGPSIDNQEENLSNSANLRPSHTIH